MTFWELGGFLDKTHKHEEQVKNKQCTQERKLRERQRENVREMNEMNDKTETHTREGNRLMHMCPKSTDKDP
jgi:hypothetical protein